MPDHVETLTTVPVEVLCLSVSPPLIKKGKITSQEAGFCEVLLDHSRSALEPGMRVVIEGGPGSGLRLTGVIAQKDGHRLRVETERSVQPDKRAFPRLPGGIRLRYRVLSPKEGTGAVRAWLGGQKTPGHEGTWFEPDPFMDFSGSGIRFQDQLRCQVDDFLLVEVQVPPAENRWRATARVVRVEPLRPEETEALDDEQQRLGATHQIAIHFVDLPAEAREALTAFTLRIQNALLRIP